MKRRQTYLGEDKEIPDQVRDDGVFA